MDELTISSVEFKALSSKNRTKMLKLLNERNHTLTELSRKIGLSSPSSKQHLDVLRSAQLVEQIDEGRKWKYYSLTKKGKKILHSKENQTQIFILLSISSVAFLLTLSMIFLPVLTGSQLSAGVGVETAPLQIEKDAQESDQRSLGIPLSASSAVDKEKIDEEQEQPTKPDKITAPTQDQNPLVILTVVLGLVTVVLGFYYFRPLRVKI